MPEAVERLQNMPIVWIVLPVMVFLVLSGIVGRTLTDRHRWTVFGIASLAALLAGAATLVPLAHPGHWQDHLQFAWIGVHGRGCRALTIGGAATETENIGWPGNFRFPEVRLTPGTGDMLGIETSSHSGFVRRESDNKILIGQLVAEGGNAVTTFTEDGVEHHFQFEFRPCFSGGPFPTLWNSGLKSRPAFPSISTVARIAHPGGRRPARLSADW